MRPGLASAVGLIASIAALWPRALAAQSLEPPGVALRWTSDETAGDCRAGGDLATAIARRIGRPLEPIDQADLVIEGRTESTATGIVVTITARDAHGAILGQRVLTGADLDCRELDESVELIVAMIIDANDRGSTPPPTEVRTETRVPPPTLPETRRRRLAFGVSVLASAGKFPEWNAGISAGAAMSIGGAGAVVELGLWRPARAEQEMIGSTLHVAAVAAAVCPAVGSRPRWTVSVCLGVQGGALVARGFGFADNRRDVALLVDITSHVTVDLALWESWLLRPAVGGSLPLIRPEIAFETSSGTTAVLYQPDPVAALIQLGLWRQF
jgi:hypothetical protein